MVSWLHKIAISLYNNFYLFIILFIILTLVLNIELQNIFVIVF